MNRIQHLVDEAWGLSCTAKTASLQQRSPTRPADEQCHCTFTPLHYERNYAYPLIVWMHGPDDDERQVTRVVPLVSHRNYAAVGPRGTVPATSAGYDWSQEPDEIELAETRVLKAIAAARDGLNIAPDRIFLAGYDAGGTMALRLALRRPEMFAGVISFGGPFPTKLQPLARLHLARRLKVFLAAGLESEHYTQAEVCRNLRLLHTAGMSVCLRLYPCGQELLTNMLSDMDRWIMEQIAPLPDLVDEPSHRSRGK